ncbi:hypothetical protein N9276_01645 [Rhodopirellula sp.]|nr:hypothetical protein [Rhodopirellula sp.]
MHRNARVGQLLQNRRSYRVRLCLTLPSNMRIELLWEVLLSRLGRLSRRSRENATHAENPQGITVAACRDGNSTKWKPANIARRRKNVNL